MTLTSIDGFTRTVEASGTLSSPSTRKSSGRQTVTLDALQETALCHGWIDTHGQRIDDERWAIRFAPRRPGSSWSDLNRRRVRRLLDEGRMTAAGIAALPDDL